MVRHDRNSARLEGGIIFIVQSGDQSYEAITSLTKEVEKLSRGLKEVKILVDHKGVGKIDIGARKAAFNVARHLPYDKMAFYGTSPYMTGLINLLARSVGKQHSIYFAKSLREAQQWLK